MNIYNYRRWAYDYGALDARGVANAGFTVEVNGVPTTRTGGDYFGVGTFNNSSGAVLGELEIEITDPGPPPVPQPTEVYSLNTTGRTDPYVIPETPEEFVYDLDGNLLTDGRWDYVWDGENRLVSMTIRAQVVTDTAMTRQRMLFDYDSSGRRIRTRTEEYVSSAWVPVSEQRYLYDGWNIVAELDDTSVTRSMTWGPDLSGTEQGAGGVGGLLWTVDDNSDGMVPGYDGNGNIIAWLDISDGSLAGTREYGAFGEDVTFTGVSHQIPFGFSTKYQDSLSGLHYYGYRYYSASTGRWLNRDPMRERGGANLYGFVGNNPISLSDVLGLFFSPSYQNQMRQHAIREDNMRRHHPQAVLNYWTPWYSTSHEIDIEFPGREYSNMKTLLDNIYNDLRRFQHFATPENRGGSVKVSGTTARFRAPFPLNVGQWIMSWFTDLTYYNVVTLSFDDSNKTVTGVAEPGHILEGTRHWRASIMSTNLCGITIRTWARERSVSLIVEGTRRIDSLFGPDYQKIVWDDYLNNIGQYWKTSRNAKVSDVR